MPTDDASNLLPSPLRDVFAHERISVPAAGYPADWSFQSSGSDPHDAGRHVNGGAAAPRCVRWEVYGLPGLGKSTLVRAVARLLAPAGVAALVLPEAVPYAVQVRGIALPDLEPFLDTVNAQADVLADRFAGAPAHGPRVVLRDPAGQQNESYRFVLHALRNPVDPVARALASLGATVASGAWSDAVAADVGQGLWARHAELRTAPAGPWVLGHVVLTTGESTADLALSVERQRHPDRDPRLVTDVSVLLGGYLATLRHAEATTRATRALPVVFVDPRWPVLDAAQAVVRATLALVGTETSGIS